MLVQLNRDRLNASRLSAADVQAAIVEAGAVFASARTHDGWHDVPVTRLMRDPRRVPPSLTVQRQAALG